MAGIVRYGSYVPFFRLQRKAIGAGKGSVEISNVSVVMFAVVNFHCACVYMWFKRIE